MELKTAIHTRRALRTLAKVDITEADVRELAEIAALAASCSNKQPWRFAFARSQTTLPGVFASLSRGNALAKEASMIVGVWSQPDFDHVTPDGRQYFLFDTGMAVAHLLLAATERGLVAHPIAGFDAQLAKQALGLAESAVLITLIVVGGRSATLPPGLSEAAVASETTRPPRRSFEEFATVL